jgi:16S rRNA (cytosine1402-N4)-methyltransferase
VHKPVLLNEVLEIFNPQFGQTYIDATINGGGHALPILEKVGQEGMVIGIDWDRELIRELKIKNEKLKVNNLKLVCANYADLKSIAREHNLDKISGILFDLGFSSHHLEESGRGFSFYKDEPLDMRYNPYENELTAEKIINTWKEEAIETILREFGEERFSRRIARGIAEARKRQKISRTGELVRIISKCVPQRGISGRIHFATRTFQAFRIAVNREFENLKKALEESRDILTDGGKIVVISFHSLEDRIVKIFFRHTAEAGELKILTRKPISPAYGEIKNNPRARSAKLRAATRI